MYLFTFIALFLFNYVSASTNLVNENVLTLKEDNFDEVIKSNSFVVVKFYAPWCGHCQSLAPEWEKAAEVFRKSGSHVKLAKVDATEQPKLAGKYEVRGYPTIKIFRNGEVSDYKGPRVSDQIVKYLLKESEPASVEITTTEEFEKLRDADLVVVGFFSKEGKSSKLAESFFKAADKNRKDLNVKFAYTSDSKLASELSHNDDKIILFRSKLRSNPKFDKMEIEFDGYSDSEEILKFVNNNWASTVIINEANVADRLSSLKRPIITMYADSVDYELNPKGSNYFRNRLAKVAVDFKESVAFVLADKKLNMQTLQRIGLECKPNCAAAVNNGLNYVPETEFSYDALRQFASDLVAGKVEPHIKSEDIPVDNDSPVKTVVGKTFNDIVMDTTKDVLIEFYAPWCGHCKSLAPVWEKLGEQMKDYPDIVIAKIDATANDTPSQFAIKGFPTIFFVPHDKKSAPIPYNGARDTDSFVSFLKSSSSKFYKTAEKADL